MSFEACSIINLSKKLERAFPQTQFLWHPSTAAVGYTSNFNWSGYRDSELIDQIKAHHADAEIIQLTVQPTTSVVYYK